MGRLKELFFESPFEYILVAYMLFCCALSLIARCLDKRMVLNPHNDMRYYFLCQWYQSPKTLRDHFFKKLATWPLFWEFRKEFETVAFVSVLLAGLFLLFGVAFIS